jgi:nucleoside-diphosphate-sugar epimerase
MEDAIRATLELMHAPKEKLTVRSSYNLSGCSFTPSQLANEIKKHIPDFKIDYVPDFRQAIADSWPNSIDDSNARNDWGWKEKYGTEQLVEMMINNVDISLIEG